MKALIVATVHNFISSFEKNDIKILQEMGYEVWCACNMEDCDGRLEDLKVKLVHIPFTRSPFSLQNIKAYQLLKKIIKQQKFDLVHCHTPVGGVLGRMAANKNHVSKIMYTVHGFHFCKGAPIQNWLLFYPIERYLAKKTDILITINREDYQRAKTFHAKRVEYIPGVGVDIEENQKIYNKISRIEKRKELGIPENAYLMVSVGELSKRKNHQIIIRAMSKIRKHDLWYIICGKGDLKEELEKIAQKERISSRVHLIGQRDDVIEILSCSDLFVFPSKREGLPFALMEAMSVGIQVLASDIRGNKDLIAEKKRLIPVNKVESWKNAIQKEMKKKKKPEYHMEKFDVHQVQRKMRYLYKE